MNRKCHIFRLNYNNIEITDLYNIQEIYYE